MPTKVNAIINIMNDEEYNAVNDEKDTGPQNAQSLRHEKAPLGTFTSSGISTEFFSTSCWFMRSNSVMSLSGAPPMRSDSWLKVEYSPAAAMVGAQTG